MPADLEALFRCWASMRWRTSSKPWRRWGLDDPKRLPRAVQLRASDESSYITGIDLPVDAGIVAV